MEKVGKPWIGVGLDGTLAHAEQYFSPAYIGNPIPEMMSRVKAWLEEGFKVKIFTARASVPEHIPAVKKWLEQYGLGDLEITCSKDYYMVELWDDRAVSVIKNTGLSILEAYENA